MRFGVMLPHFLELASPENVRIVAREAETLGFDSVWTTDHVAMVDQLKPRFGETFYESTSILAYLAGITARVRIGVSALILPYRNPVVTAKALASIDALSGGRLIVGAASGWADQEFAALGVPFAERARLSDQALRLMIELWTVPEPSWQDERFQFERMAFGPKPIQKPHPPIWVGGNSPRGMQRAVKFGQAWHLAPPSIREVGQARKDLSAALELAGRSADDIELTIRLPLLVLSEEEAARLAPAGPGWHPRAEMQAREFAGGELEQVALIGSAEQIADRLHRHREAGATYVVFDLFYSLPQLRGRPVDAVLTTMRRFVEHVQPLLQAPR